MELLNKQIILLDKSLLSKDEHDTGHMKRYFDWLPYFGKRNFLALNYFFALKAALYETGPWAKFLSTKIQCKIRLPAKMPWHVYCL